MSQLHPSVVGYDAPRFIVFLVESLPEIQTINLFRPPSSQPIQHDPSISVPEQSLVAQALAIRENLNLPFWDSLFLYLSNHPMNAKNIFKRATLHNSQNLDSLSIHRDDCTETRLRELIQALPLSSMLAISSKVSTKQGKTLHLPMLDFHCQASLENDMLVRSVLMELNLRGYVARSGRSYHFYGHNLVDEQSLITTLGKALLFCPIIDRAWIAHQLLERACGLRISPGKNYQTCPEIIYEL